MQTAPPTPFKLLRPGDKKITQKRGDRGSGTCREPVSLKLFHYSQKRWYQKTSHISKAAKSICKKSSIQKGRFDPNTISPPERGFSFQDRSSGCLSVDPCCKESKSIPPFSLEGETLSVHLPAFRTGFLTKNFYQMPEATAGLSSGSWGASVGLPGRFSDNGLYKGAMSGTDPANRRIIREARLSDKSREISVKTNPEAGIPRVSNRHCGNEVFLARNENAQNSESGREISLRTNFSKTTSQSSGPVAGYLSSYNNCSSVFSKSFERPFQGSKFLRRKAKLPDSGCAFLGVKRGVDVVEKLASFPQREKFSGSKRTGNDFLGCLKERLGSSFGPLKNRRTLVLGRANPAHKCSRTSSGFFSNKSLATQNRQATCSVCNRQSNCSNIHKQIRWNPLTSTFTLSNRTMAFCSENEPNPVSGLCAGKKNCIADRKSRVFKDSLKRMLNPQVFQQILLKRHGLEVDLFASRINHQLTAFVSWRPEPGAMACDAFNLTWGLMKGYLFPPFCLIHRCIKKIQQDQAECILITPVWKSRPWYPVILSLLVDRLLLLPKDSKLLQLPGTDKVHPLCSQKNFRLAAWPLSGKKYQNRGFLRKCQRYCRPHRDKKLPVSMKVPGRHGVAGVIRDKLILFNTFKCDP